MAKKDHFLQQLQRTMHLKQAASHVDKPSEQTMEELEAEHKKLEIQRTKAEIDYWQGKQTNVGASDDGPVFGLKSNQRKFFNFRKTRRSWK